MTHYGADSGGFWGCRQIDDDDAFEVAVNRALGERIRANPKLACDMWCALANVDWQHDNGDTADYSFRAAGDLVAAIYGDGMYMDWYCCGEYPRVTAEIEASMNAEGWHSKIENIKSPLYKRKKAPDASTGG